MDGWRTSIEQIATQGPVPAAGTYSGFTLPSNFQRRRYPTAISGHRIPSLYKTPHGDVSPRLGFAWQMTQKPVLVLRGGYGVYYDRHSATLAEQTITQPPFATLQFISGDPNGPATLQSPFVPLIPPASSYPIFMPRTPTSTPFIEGTNPHMQDGTTQEYNLNVQYALGHGYLLRCGLCRDAVSASAGAGGVRSGAAGEPRQSDERADEQLDQQRDGPAADSGSERGIAVYGFGLYRATTTHCRRASRSRMQHGLELQGSYTWAKNLDEVNGEIGTDIFELQLPTNDQTQSAAIVVRARGRRSRSARGGELQLAGAADGAAVRR